MRLSRPERPQGDGLAAGVRAGHDQRRCSRRPGGCRSGRRARSGPDGGRRAGRPRAASTVSGRTGVHLGGQRRLGRPEVEAGQRVERLAQRRPRWRADEGRQLVEDPLDLGPLGDLRLAPGVAQLDRHERLDEQGLAAARGVVDDALDPAAAPRPGPARRSARCAA